VISGAPAYSKVFQDDTLVGDIQTSLNPTVRAFGRFCSGSLAGKESGFDRPIYFANEESTGPTGSFDARGSQSVAIFDNNGVGEAHALSFLGFFPWENTLVMPRRDGLTVVMGMEDGPASTDNQLYMYVGRKSRGANATVLERNGLVNGKLYAWRSTNLAMNSEATFVAQGTSITGSVGRDSQCEHALRRTARGCCRQPAGRTCLRVCADRRRHLRQAHTDQRLLLRDHRQRRPEPARPHVSTHLERSSESDRPDHAEDDLQRRYGREWRCR
jgi:hypothetical protein